MVEKKEHWRILPAVLDFHIEMRTYTCLSYYSHLSIKTPFETISLGRILMLSISIDTLGPKL